MALDLFNSQTPEEVCSYLTELSARIKGKNARSLARALVRAANDYIHPVIASAAIFNEPRYEIIPSGKSSQALVALFLGQVGTNCRISDVRTVLMDVHKFLSKLRAPDTDPLTPNDVKSIIQQVRLPDALTVITAWRPLLIFCFHATDPDYNSSYAPNLNAVLLTAPRANKEGNHPYYIFLHELGHAFQVALTKDPTAVPSSFLPVFHLTFGTDPEQVSANDWPDIFADTFSLAMSYGTELAIRNPFCKVFDEFAQVAILRYFEIIISDASKNRKALAKGAFDIQWDAQRIADFENG
jgi:hypothetical protein